MHLTQQVQNKLRRLIQTYGGRKAKSCLWNSEFARGRWKCLDDTAEDCVYPIIEKYANDGRILDLGCGSGNTGNELTATKYQVYTGVDISDVAIDKAKRRTEDNGRAMKNQYLQADIVSYQPTGRFDVILFRNSLYYVSRARIGAMLQRYSKYLKEGGVFIVTMCNDSDKNKGIVEIINRDFKIKQEDCQQNTAVIVFERRL